MDNLLLAILLGIGLAAACGFRIFVPLLVMSIATRSGEIHLASGFDWIGSTPALVIFATATALEIGAYYIPWLDSLLDLIASPGRKPSPRFYRCPGIRQRSSSPAKTRYFARMATSAISTLTSQPSATRPPDIATSFQYQTFSLNPFEHLSVLGCTVVVPVPRRAVYPDAIERARSGSFSIVSPHPRDRMQDPPLVVRSSLPFSACTPIWGPLTFTPVTRWMICPDPSTPSQQRANLSWAN